MRLPRHKPYPVCDGSAQKHTVHRHHRNDPPARRVRRTLLNLLLFARSLVGIQGHRAPGAAPRSHRARGASKERVTSRKRANGLVIDGLLAGVASARHFAAARRPSKLSALTTNSTKPSPTAPTHCTWPLCSSSTRPPRSDTPPPPRNSYSPRPNKTTGVDHEPKDQTPSPALNTLGLPPRTLQFG